MQVDDVSDYLIFLNFTGCSLTAVMSFLTANFFFFTSLKIFLHSRCTMYCEEKFFFTREKNFSHQGEKFLLVKFKKAICSFIFLFFPMLKFFFAVRKYFKMVHSGVKMGPRTLLKFLVSLEISKLCPQAHFYSLLNHFKIFLTARKIFLIEKREK